MAMFLAAKFSQEEMPVTYDPGGLNDLKPQDFVVVPRNGTEDIAFVAALEYKSVHQLKLRRSPYPKVLRRATEQEIEAWWSRKGEERRALVIAKEKARELKLDIKISHVRIDPKEHKAIFHFTSDQRVDFRQLVKDLNALLKLRIELWQIGVRDEARMVDGYGVCGQQTCCSSWLKEFRPITIRMAKDQDINLPPSKLSGQCGRLLCCLSYEVDQYRAMAREALPKGATVKWGGKTGVIVDRNLVARTYLVAEEGGATQLVKEEEIEGREAMVPEQMRRQGKKFLREDEDARDAAAEIVDAEAEPREPKKPKKFKTQTRERETPQRPREEKASAPPEPAAEEAAAEPGQQRRPGKRRRGRGGRGGNRPEGAPAADTHAGASDAPKPPKPAGDAPQNQGRKKKRRKPPNNRI